MITRPLDLASRLRVTPRHFDALFWVNVGALALFFGLFGSRFVLAPGLGVDFYLPEIGGAHGAAVRTTHVISMARSGLIFTDDGALPLEQIEGWLREGKARQSDVDGEGVEAVLLIRASAEVPVADLASVTSAAQALGFRVQIAALDPEASGGAHASGERTSE